MLDLTLLKIMVFGSHKILTT